MSVEKTFGEWTVVEKLGEGGMCAVFRVKPTSGVGPERALKVLLDQEDNAIERFISEGDLLKKILHPNIVRVHQLQRDARPPWLVLDLLGGRDLEEELEIEGPMQPERAARLFANIASGLGEVHKMGVRHRDIKPANIMVGPDGVPRLIDFGIARETVRAHVTRAGFVVGTAAYLPPEIFVDPSKAQQIQDSESADVYALGQSFAEVLGGRLLFSKSLVMDEGALLMLAMKEKTERTWLDVKEWNPSTPDSLCELVKKATHRDPKKRFLNAKSFEEALRSWISMRTTADVAPISRVQASSLPPVPETGPLIKPTYSKPPPPPPVQAPSIASAPASSPPTASSTRSSIPVMHTAGKAAAGAAGAASVTAIVVVSLLAMLGGVGAMWYFMPSGPPSDAVKVAKKLGPSLSKCRSKGVVQVTVSVLGSNVSTKGTSSKCIKRVMSEAKWPKGTYSLTIPVVFTQNG